MKSLKCFLTVILAVVLLVQLSTVESAPFVPVQPDPSAPPRSGQALRNILQRVIGDSSSNESNPSVSSEEASRPLISRSYKSAY